MVEMASSLMQFSVFIFYFLLHSNTDSFVSQVGVPSHWQPPQSRAVRSPQPPPPNTTSGLHFIHTARPSGAGVKNKLPPQLHKHMYRARYERRLSGVEPTRGLVNVSGEGSRKRVGKGRV